MRNVWRDRERRLFPVFGSPNGAEAVTLTGEYLVPSNIALVN